MLEYLVQGRTRRELFRLLWGKRLVGSVSALARLAGTSFSAVHKELEAMRDAGLAVSERLGSELQYRAQVSHPHGALLHQLASVSGAHAPDAQEERDEEVRSWLAGVGAPLGAPEAKVPQPPLEEVLAEAVALSHRDASVARVLPLVLWRHRNVLDVDRLAEEATRRDERQALGYLLELAGRLGGEASLVAAARRLRDGRRRRARWFFARPRGRYALAATRRNTPAEALRWGYHMNMGLDAFRSTFDKFVDRR